MESPLTLEHCRALDGADPLAPLREAFDLPPGVIYLDGNSLGPLPRAARTALHHAIDAEWGVGLIRSWSEAGWLERAGQVGDRLAPLIGAGPGEVMVADSSTVNLYKVLSVAMELVERVAPRRRTLLTEADNFPTDRYIAQGLCAARGWTLREVAPGTDGVFDAGPLADPEVGVLLLTQVHYRTGALHDMQAINRTALAAGVLTVWDLAHSAGALPVDVHADGAACDFAVGCGYKYLNGGPGAPAYVWVHPRHVDQAEQPLRGWLGHADAFAFAPGYVPAPGIARYVCGTPPILSLTALQAGIETLRAADAVGGMAAVRAKSLALTRCFRQAVMQCAPPGALVCLTPDEPARRGSQLSFALGPAASRLRAADLMTALIRQGVIGDFRPGHGAVPDILRFGFAPLYNTFEQVWIAAGQLGALLRDG